MNENAIRTDDGSTIKIRNTSAFAIYVVLALEQIVDPNPILSAFDISERLRGALSSATISRILWEEGKLEKREGVLFKILEPPSDRRNKIIRIRREKPESGKEVMKIRYIIASQKITSPPDLLSDWRNNFIVMRYRKGGRNITQSRAWDLSRLQSYIKEGKYKEAFSLYSSHQLDHIGKSISGTARQKLLVNRDRIYGGLLMSHGDYKKAIQLLRQAMERGQRIGEIGEVAHAAGNLAAALRMMGIREVSIAQKVCIDAIGYVRNARQSLDREKFASLLRWLHTTLSSDFTIYENYESAFKSTEEALDYVDLSGDERYLGETEIRFRRAKVHLHNSDIDKCEQELEIIEKLAVLPGVRSVDWIGKWVPRLKADILIAKGKSGEAINALLQGWHMNSNYGFQRVHIAQRLLKLNYVDSSMTRGIEILHKRLLGIYSSKCKYCGGRTLIDRLKCAIYRTWPTVPPSFWF